MVDLLETAARGPHGSASTAAVRDGGRAGRGGTRGAPRTGPGCVVGRRVGHHVLEGLPTARVTPDGYALTAPGRHAHLLRGVPRTAPGGAGVHVRNHHRARWSPWRWLPAASDHAPDRGPTEPLGQPPRVSTLLWTSAADGLVGLAGDAFARVRDLIPSRPWPTCSPGSTTCTRSRRARPGGSATTGARTRPPADTGTPAAPRVPASSCTPPCRRSAVRSSAGPDTARRPYAVGADKPVAQEPCSCSSPAPPPR